MHHRMLAAGLLLTLGCGTPTALAMIGQDRAQQAQQHADAAEGDRLQLARELPASPPDVVVAFVDLVAEGGQPAALQACLLFTDQAAAQLAAAAGTPDCPTAIQRLHGQVSDPATYAEVTVPDTAWTRLGETATVNGCAVTWSIGLAQATPTPPPGPLPGQWSLTRLDGRGWQITTYQLCP